MNHLPHTNPPLLPPLPLCGPRLINFLPRLLLSAVTPRLSPCPLSSRIRCLWDEELSVIRRDNLQEVQHFRLCRVSEGCLRVLYRGRIQDRHPHCHHPNHQRLFPTQVHRYVLTTHYPQDRSCSNFLRKNVWESCMQLKAWRVCLSREAEAFRLVERPGYWLDGYR